MPRSRFADAAHAVGLAVLGLVGSVVLAGSGGAVGSRRAPAALDAPAPPVAATPSVTVAPAPPAAFDLPVIGYRTPPVGLPADPAPMSADPLTEGVRPRLDLAVYDAPGGLARAYLPPMISGVPVAVPIVARSQGWVAVLLPSANRTIGWLPPADWDPVPLRDLLVLRRQAHELTWYRDGVRQRSWTVTIGSAATPTPLGRTFVLGRSTLVGAVYAGLDVLALGAVPDDPFAVPTGLRGAHIGIHSWHRDEFGRSVSNGCVRVPGDGQRLLLETLMPGTGVVVLD